MIGRVAGNSAHGQERKFRLNPITHGTLAPGDFAMVWRNSASTEAFAGSAHGCESEFEAGCARAVPRNSSQHFWPFDRFEYGNNANLATKSKKAHGQVRLRRGSLNRKSIKVIAISINLLVVWQIPLRVILILGLAIDCASCANLLAHYLSVEYP